MGLERKSWLLGTPLKARNRSGRDWNAGRRKRGKSRNGRPSNRRLQDNGNKAAWKRWNGARRTKLNNCGNGLEEVTDKTRGSEL
jgi:hypothetical protein